MKIKIWTAVAAAGLLASTLTYAHSQTQLVDETLSGTSSMSGAPADDSAASTPDSNDAPAMSGDSTDSGNGAMSGNSSDDSSAASGTGSPDTATGDDDY